MGPDLLRGSGDCPPQVWHLQFEVLLEGLVAGAGVEEAPALLDGEGGDEAFDRARGREALGAEDARVAGGDTAEVEGHHVEAAEAAQGILGQLALPLVQVAAQDLGVDEVAHADVPPAESAVQIVGLRRDRAVEVIDPDGGVDEDLHESALPALAGKIGLAVELATQAPHLSLLVKLRQRGERFIQRLPVRGDSGQTHRFQEEILVYLDVDSHSRPPKKLWTRIIHRSTGIGVKKERTYTITGEKCVFVRVGDGLSSENTQIAENRC
jgi:hypothetical protein